MGEESKAKWEGKSTIELAGNSVEQVWPHIEDFLNFHKLIPLDVCYKVEGVPNQPGLIRYCATIIKGDDDASAAADEPIISNWANEKLLAIDPIQHSLTYEVGENNMGFEHYVATLKVLPINNEAEAEGEGEGEGAGGCKIEWEFASDPVEGWELQDLKSYLQSTLEYMGKKIEAACSKPT